MHETTELHTSFPSPPSYQHKPNIIFSPSSSPSPHSMMPVTTTTEDNQSSGSRKTSGSSPRPPEKSPNCPRCDSPNTKFCYYNNYSLSQPRHFCKTCRRYWTKGGALRNVPIGGGCRKTNKKAKSSSSRDSSSSSEISSAFRFLHGLSAPPIDFQFGRLSSPNSQFLSLGDLSTANPSSSSLMGLNSYNNNWGIQESGSGASSMNVNTSLASSIECLSSINQDLHWKLQQQRLAMVMGGGGGGGGESNQNQIQKESCTTTSASSAVVLPSGFLENQMINQQQQQQHPLSFQNLEISKPVATSAVVTPTTTTGEWFFQNPYTTNQHMSNGNDTTTISNWNGGVHHHQGWSSYSDLPQ